MKLEINQSTANQSKATATNEKEDSLTICKRDIKNEITNKIYKYIQCSIAPERYVNSLTDFNKYLVNRFASESFVGGCDRDYKWDSIIYVFSQTKPKAIEYAGSIKKHKNLITWMLALDNEPSIDLGRN